MSGKLELTRKFNSIQFFNFINCCSSFYRFHRPLLVSETSEIRFTIRILQGNGEFLVFEGSNVVCTGRVTLLDSETGLEVQHMIEAGVEEDKKNRDESKFDYLTTREIYKELRIRGYDYGPKFHGLHEARSDGQIGQVKWNGHFISFMDSMLHISLIALPLRALFVPIGFDSVRIDPRVLFGEIERVKQEKQEKEFEDFKLKKEFLYFSDKTAETEHIEMNMNQRVESIMDDKADDNDNDESKADIPLQFYQTAFMSCDDSKISLIPVVFDVNNRSIITKGLEVKGMIPFPVPRQVEQKGLLLERYEHVPYIEEKISMLNSEAETTLNEYVWLCNELSRFLIFKKDQRTENKTQRLPNNLFTLTKKYYQEIEMSESNPYRILMLLRDLFELKLEKDDDVEVFSMNSFVTEDKMNAEGDSINRELLIKYNISADLTATMQTNERLMRPLLDTVLENHNDRANIRIIEVNPSMHLFAPRLIHLLKSSFVGNVNIDYTYANTGDQIVSNEMENLHLKSVEWNRSTNAFLNDINSVDLLIYRMAESTIEGWSIEKQLESFNDCLKENGFLMVLARTDISQMEQKMNKYFGYDSKNDYGSNNLMKTFIKSTKNVSFGLVGKKQDASYSAFLFRKLRTVYDPTKYNVLKINECFDDWLDKLKEMFIENKNKPQEAKPIWLIANDKFNGLIGMVNCLRLEPGGAFIRCIFDLDGSLPDAIDFNKSPFNEIGYFDLVFNVYQKGMWGAFRYLSLPAKNETVDTQFAYLNVETRGDLSSFKWYESEHKYFDKIRKADQIEGLVLCDVYCSSLNFKVLNQMI